MELKLVGEDVERKQVEPLIEPYGIEIEEQLTMFAGDPIPLIEPYGIEICLC